MQITTALVSFTMRYSEFKNTEFNGKAWEEGPHSLSLSQERALEGG